MGVESIDAEHLSVRMVARTLPGKQFVISRELRARAARALRGAGITTAPEIELRRAAGS
jgi:small conductance mechanosensitive channel